MDDTSEAKTFTMGDISEAKERTSGGNSGSDDDIQRELFETHHRKLKETVKLLQLLVSDDYDDDNGDGKENKYLGDEINAINGKVSNSEKHHDDEKKEIVYDESTNELIKSNTQTNVEKITDPKEGSEQAEKKEILDQEISEDQIKSMSKREDSENEVKDDCDDNSSGKDKTECNSKRKSQIKQTDSSAIANDNTTEGKVLPSDSAKQESEKRKDPSSKSEIKKSDPSCELENSIHSSDGEDHIEQLKETKNMTVGSESESFQSVKSDSNEEANCSTNNISKRKRNVSGSSSSGISVDETLRKKRISNTFSKNAIVSLTRCAFPKNAPENTSKQENSDSEEDNLAKSHLKIGSKRRDRSDESNQGVKIRRKKAVLKKKTSESDYDSSNDEVLINSKKKFPTKKKVKRNKDSDSEYEPKNSKSNKKAKGSDAESESKDSDSENNGNPRAAKLKKKTLASRKKNRSSDSDFEDDIGQLKKRKDKTVGSVNESFQNFKSDSNEVNSKNALVSISRRAVPKNVGLPVNTSKKENSDSEDDESDKGVKVGRKKAVLRKKTKESNSDSNDDEGLFNAKKKFPTKKSVKRNKDSDSEYEPKKYSKSNKKAKGSDAESESKDSDYENSSNPRAAKLIKKTLASRKKNRSSNSDFGDDSLKPMDKILDGKLKKNRNEYEDKRPKCEKDSDSDSEDESRKSSKQVSNLKIPCKKNSRRKLFKEGATSDSESENESKKREKVSGTDSRISNRLRRKNSRTKIKKEVHIESVSHSNSTSKSSGSSDSSSDSDDDAKGKLSNKRGGNKKKTSKSSDTSSSDEKSKKAKKTKYTPDYVKLIKRLRKYLRIAGIHVNNYDMLWKDCHSNKAKSEALVKLLKKEGLHGTPTIENCKRLHEERKIKKEVKDFDTETTGIPIETHLNSENDVTSDNNSVKCPFCKEFFKAKGLLIHVSKIHGSAARQTIADQDNSSSVEEDGNAVHSIPIETQLNSENDITSDNNSVKCPFCKDFFKAKGLVIHITKIHGSNARQTIVDHQDSSSSVEEGGNALHSIPMETQLNSENVTSDNNTVKCPFCKQFFKAKGLVIHITKIHGSTARQTIADQDNSSSVKEEGNALHSIPIETQLNSENDVTSDNNSVKCPFCKDFFKAKGLVIHISKIHGSNARQTIADQDNSSSVKEDGNALHSAFTVRRNSIEKLDETPLSSRKSRFQGNTQSIQLPETEETKNLTNSELKRLVLLEHLKLLRMQQQKLSA